jgi:hypothetical protein
MRRSAYSFSTLLSSSVLQLQVTVTNQNYMHEEIKEQANYMEFLLPFCSVFVIIPSV